MNALESNLTKEKLFDKVTAKGFWNEIPDRNSKTEEFIVSLFELFFPIGNKCASEKLEFEQNYLRSRILFHELHIHEGKICCLEDFRLENELFDQFSAIFDLLYEDAEAIFLGDPAANSIEEVIHIYPGFYAIYIHRIAHQIYNLNLPLLARKLAECAHSKTGIDIHPGAEIGKHFGIDHGTGIVIGETSIIGNNVKVYQGVTLGAISVDKSMSSVKRHPTIEDNVIIYAGATILGGETIIGKNSTIGGNVFITKSVAPNSIVYQKNDITVKTRPDLKENIEIAV
jgi:serine O-acetyltransferase